MTRTRWLCVVTALAAVTGGCGVMGSQERLVTGPAVGLRAPDFKGGVAWINSEPLSTRDLRGKVVLVDFWEYTCVNCLRTLPYLKSWYEKYADMGLVIVGVHTPEFVFAQDADEVAAGVERLGITYPVVADSNYAIWNAYSNRWWPRKFLVDKDGVIRYDHIGEGGYRKTELALQQLLRERDPSLTFPPFTDLVRDTDVPGAVCYPITPELYCGYRRGPLGNPDGFFEEMQHTYQDPGPKKDGFIYLHGSWRATHEAAIHEGGAGEGYIAIRFHAADVNAVFRPQAQRSVEIEVTLDGRPVPVTLRGDDVFERDGKTYFLVDAARMYGIIAGDYGERELRLYPQGVGVGIYAYTFGTACIAPPNN